MCSNYILHCSAVQYVVFPHIQFSSVMRLNNFSWKGCLPSVINPIIHAFTVTVTFTIIKTCFFWLFS